MTEHTPQCSRGWAARCASSKGKKCRCACGGHNHGGRLNNAEDRTLATTPTAELEYAWNESRPTITPETLRRDDARVIRFERLARPGYFSGIWGDIAEARVYLVTSESIEQLPRRYTKHSPTGFEWGYGGSGPADTALNILALLVPVKEANRFYQDFKFAFVARVPQEGGEIRLADVREWLSAQYAIEQAVTTP